MQIILATVPPADHAAWQISLNASDVIGLAGILATAFGIAFGVYQMLEAHKAKRETVAAREMLLKQQAAQHFSDAAAGALNLYRTIRAAKWRESAETAVLLIANLANARGFPDKILSAEHKEKFEIPLSVLAKLAQHIPLEDNEEVPRDLRNELSQSCQEVLVAVNLVAGSLKIRTALGGETDEHQTYEPHQDSSVPNGG